MGRKEKAVRNYGVRELAPAFHPMGRNEKAVRNYGVRELAPAFPRMGRKEKAVRNVFGGTPNTACGTHALPRNRLRAIRSTENVEEPKK